AHLYVVRTGVYFARAILFQLIVDGKSLGGIAPNTYHLLVLSPGQHTIAAVSNENQASTTLMVEAGHNYFLRIVPQWGLVTGRVGLETLDENAGREAVQAGARAQGLAMLSTASTGVITPSSATLPPSQPPLQPVSVPLVPPQPAERQQAERQPVTPLPQPQRK